MGCRPISQKKYVNKALFYKFMVWRNNIMTKNILTELSSVLKDEQDLPDFFILLFLCFALTEL